MKKLLTLGAVAVVMFGLSAGTSYYLNRAQTKHDKGGSTEPASKGPKSSKPGASTSEFSSTSSLSPAARPQFDPKAEEIVRIQTHLKDSQNRLDAEEKRLANRKKLMELIYDDMRKERTAVDQKRKELNELLKSVDERVTELEGKNQEMREKLRKYEELVKIQQKTLTSIEGVESERVKQMASMYDSMDPEKAGYILMQMTDTGNLETAVKILSAMKERQAARVLEAIPDQNVVIQIMDKLKTLKRPSAAEKKQTPP
jgi:flagellar motility protein MotE (MotC chaperone)